LPGEPGANVAFDKRQFNFVADGQTGFAIQRDEPREAEKLEHQLVELTSVLANPEADAGEREELKTRLDNVTRKLSEVRERQKLGPASADAVAVTSMRLDRTRSERVASDVISGILRQVGLSLGDTITEDTFKQVRDLAAQTDEHLHVAIETSEQGGKTLVFIAR